MLRKLGLYLRKQLRATYETDQHMLACLCSAQAEEYGRVLLDTSVPFTAWAKLRVSYTLCIGIPSESEIPK